MAGKDHIAATSVRALAALLGKGPSTVRKWTKDRRWPFPRRAPYTAKQVEQIKTWAEMYLSRSPSQDYHDRLKEAGAFARPPSKAEQAKVAYLVERAMWMRQRRLEKEGHLHDVAACERHRLQQIMAVRGRLMELPRSLGSALAGLSAGQIEQRLEESILVILDEFSGGDHERQ